MEKWPIAKDPDYIDRNLNIAHLVGAGLWLTAVSTLDPLKRIPWEYLIAEEVVTGGVDRLN